MDASTRSEGRRTFHLRLPISINALVKPDPFIPGLKFLLVATRNDFVTPQTTRYLNPGGKQQEIQGRQIASYAAQIRQSVKTSAPDRNTIDSSVFSNRRVRDERSKIESSDRPKSAETLGKPSHLDIGRKTFADSAAKTNPLRSLMDTLDKTSWDVLISGTGLAQSLLALSLSHSGLKILHIDQNGYYGGNEAALSLTEAEAWAERFADNQPSLSFSHASIVKTEVEVENGPRLSSSRAYSLSLAPQLIYSRSKFVGAVVSSNIHNQLEFQAVGSWFVVKPTVSPWEITPKLTRVPNGREDVFADPSLSLLMKRNLMKFLRFVANFEEQRERWDNYATRSFSELLLTEFSIPVELIAPIMSLTLSGRSEANTTTKFALPRISRHLRSIGVFGPGFGAVLPKWGGLCEISQVACRACAVRGAVYVLGKGISRINARSEDGTYNVQLNGGEVVSTKHIVTSTHEWPPCGTRSPQLSILGRVTKSITIVAGTLSALFPLTSEGGVTPAGAVVLVPSESKHEPPVHILVHSSDAGECPSSQSVLYASIEMSQEQGFARLQRAMKILLNCVAENDQPKVLWTMQYQQNIFSPSEPQDSSENIFLLEPFYPGLALEDDALESLEVVWKQIIGGDDEGFMKFQTLVSDGEHETDT